MTGSGVVRFLASGFYTGRFPFAPGTVGTLTAIPFALLFTRLPPAATAAVILASLPLGAYLCGRAAREEGSEDPGWIVFDEMVGFWIAAAWLPADPFHYGAAFFLFRLFDILKPPPARWLERNAPGGWGILLDDVAAGLMARLVLLALGGLGVFPA